MIVGYCLFSYTESINSAQVLLRHRQEKAFGQAAKYSNDFPSPRRYKSQPGSHAMANYLVQRGHKVSLMVIGENRQLGRGQSFWDGVHVIETPNYLWGQSRWNIDYQDPYRERQN